MLTFLLKDYVKITALVSALLICSSSVHADGGLSADKSEWVKQNPGLAYVLMAENSPTGKLIEADSQLNKFVNQWAQKVRMSDLLDKVIANPGEAWSHLPETFALGGTKDPQKKPKWAKFIASSQGHGLATLLKQFAEDIVKTYEDTQGASPPSPSSPDKASADKSSVVSAAGPAAGPPVPVPGKK